MTENKKKSKLNVKRRHLYSLHRDSQKDHEKGRPAFVLNARITKSVVWSGTTTYDERNKSEKPLTLKINDADVYFYGNAIELVATKDLKNEWIDNKTKTGYILSDEQQDEIGKKLFEMSQLKNPYKKIKQLEEAKANLEAKLTKAKNINYELSEENQQLKAEKEIRKQNEDKKFAFSLSEHANLQDNKMTQPKDKKINQEQKIEEPEIEMEK